jgi:hypothetical protein
MEKIFLYIDCVYTNVLVSTVRVIMWITAKKYIANNETLAKKIFLVNRCEK